MTDFNYKLEDVKAQFATMINDVLKDSGYQDDDVVPMDFEIPVVDFNTITRKYFVVALQVTGVKVFGTSILVLGTDDFGDDREMSVSCLSVDNLSEVLRFACLADEKK